MELRDKLLIIFGPSAVILLGYFLVVKPGCSATPRTGSDTVYTPGKTDTLYIQGEPDTVTRYITNTVYVEKPGGQHFGKDSSSYSVENEYGRAQVTTYPATDSIRIEIEPITIERLITRVDTLRFNTVDTLKITNTIEVAQPWYDTFLTGFIAAVLAVAGVVGAFVL